MGKRIAGRSRGKLAEDKATDARAKKLGWTMVTDHTNADAKGTTLSKMAQSTCHVGHTQTRPAGHVAKNDVVLPRKL